MIEQMCSDAHSITLMICIRTMFTTSVWANGVIVSVPKQEIISMLILTFSLKYFSILFDNILRVWSKSNNLLREFQFGFRKSKSTVDFIFVLSPIIDKVINHEKKKVILHVRRLSEGIRARVSKWNMI